MLLKKKISKKILEKIYFLNYCYEKNGENGEKMLVWKYS